MKLTIDVIDDAGAVGELVLASEQANVTVRLVERFGPGGGNPVFEVEGEREAVEDYLCTHWGSSSDVSDLLKEADDA